MKTGVCRPGDSFPLSCPSHSNPSEIRPGQLIDCVLHFLILPKKIPWGSEEFHGIKHFLPSGQTQLLYQEEHIAPRVTLRMHIHIHILIGMFFTVTFCMMRSPFFISLFATNLPV